MQDKVTSIIWIAILNIIIFSATLIFVFIQGNHQVNQKTEQFTNLALKSVGIVQEILVDHTFRMFQSWEEEILSNPEIAANPCDSEIIRILTDVDPQYIMFANVSADGIITCSEGGAGLWQDVSDRTYIQDVITYKTMSAGTFQIGKVTGRPSVNFGYPILDEEGNVENVLILALSLEVLNKRVQEFALPKDSEFLVTDHTGSILIHYPKGETVVGKKEFSSDIFSIILSQKQGSVLREGADGIKRIYTYSPFFSTHDNVPDSFVILGVPVEATQDMLKESSYKLLMLFFGIFVVEVIAILGYWKIRKEKR